MDSHGEPPHCSEGFVVASYVVDGELAGIGRVSFADLSERWIGFCCELLRKEGTVFDRALDGPLRHIRVKLTASNGAGMLQILVQDRPVILGALVSGRAQVHDIYVLEQWSDSLRHSASPFVSDKDDAFAAIPGLSERPLFISVPWPDLLISEDECDQARELSLHMSAAFFRDSAKAS